LPVSSLAFGFTILTFVQQLFISVSFNQESRTQRKIAISLSFLKIPVAIGVMVWYSLTTISKEGHPKSKAVLMYLFSDILIITVLMNYVLLQDTRKFGSGLKEFLKFKTKKIQLS
ncbi:uncharacterized protein VICG_01114, partial [Vittaforma corneae ATCC 50505]